MPITVEGNTWTPIGPAPVVYGPFAGRIDVAAADPSNPSVMYLGANNGGIWKTTNWLDASPTWTPLTDQPQILSLAIHEHGLVVFPGDTSLVLAAAAGPGGGILRSEDGGDTWSFLANSKFDLAEFGALVVDPNVANAQTVYVAISAGAVNFNSGSGLYKSTDGGTSWSDAGAGVFSGFVSDLLALQEGGQTVLYAADVGTGQGGSGGIFRNAGSGWHKTNFPTNSTGFQSMRLAGSTAPTEKIYISAIDNSTTHVVSRFVTTNQGSHWSALTWPDAPTGSGTHRNRHNLFAVDPANSSHVYVNTDLENNMVHNLTEWIYLSSDSGQTWKPAQNGGGDPVSGSFDGDGVFIATGDGGVVRDPVNSPVSKGGNLNTIEFYAFSLDPSNPQAGYGLFQDGPGVLRFVGAPDWQYTQPANGFGESGKIRVDPTNSSRVYYLDPNTSDPVSSPTTSARFLHSDDSGQTWTPAITGLAQINNGGVTITDFALFPGKRSILIDANHPKRLLLALRSVFETTTGGDPNTTDPKFGGKGWRDIGATMGNNGSWISAIALAPSDSNIVYAGTEDGHVFKTTNAGNASPVWTEVDSGLPLQNQRIMDLNIDPANPDHVFAVTSPFMGRDDNAPDFSGFAHVWVRNGGAWSPINGNLPKELGGEAVAVDWRGATPTIYLGTLRGAFQSTDSGATWSRIESMPRTRVTDLDFMPNLDLLGAGTIGRGAWLFTSASISFIIDKSTYGKDEFSLTPWAPAYWLQVAGFTNAELNLNDTGDLSVDPPNPAPVITITVDPLLNPTLTAQQLSTISANLPSVAQLGPVPIIPTDPTFAQDPQTFLYPYTVSFSSNAAFGALLPDQFAILTLNATLTAGQITRNASANIELIAGQNPYFEDIDLLHPAAFPTWLSFDLRFFKMTVPSTGTVKTASRFGETMTRNPADAPGFIANVIAKLTAGKGHVGSDSFENGLSQVQQTSAVEFLPQDSNGNWVFNFAVARVRLKGNTAGAQATKVRAFFRLFAAQTTATDFEPDTTYRFHSDGVPNGVTVPLLGVQNNEYVTIPCFASPRVNLLAPADMKKQLEDTPNAYTINVDPGVEVDSFFGCWLDVNRPDQKFLPLTPDPTNLDGPFSGTPHSINEMITRAPHQCLIAEIRYDDAPIPAGATSANSDKLAQRNIAWINGPNPAPLHRARCRIHSTSWRHLPKPWASINSW